MRALSVGDFQTEKSAGTFRRWFFGVKTLSVVDNIIIPYRPGYVNPSGSKNSKPGKAIFGPSARPFSLHGLLDLDAGKVAKMCQNLSQATKKPPAGLRTVW